MAGGVSSTATGSGRSRESAFGDLVAGLLDARTDLATHRFDAELAAAEAAGRLDAQTARVLRWWQRESLRTLVEHARAVVPPALTTLEVAASDVAREVESSARAWERAAIDPSPILFDHRGSPDDDSNPPADLTARRRRLLVAGLTGSTSTGGPTPQPRSDES